MSEIMFDKPLTEQFVVWHPLRCCLCGHEPGFNQSQYWKIALRRWEECDENDIPNGKYIVLCRSCSDGPSLEINNTLYIERYYSEGDICPGAMAQCSTCKFRNDLTCHHPQRWDQGLTFGKAPTAKDLGMHFNTNPLGVGGGFFDFPDCQSRLGIMLDKQK